MYYFYVLYSLKDQKLYKGVSADVEGRLARHNAGATPATKHRRPLVLIYTESFSSKTEALARERWAKTAEGGVGLKAILIQRGILDSQGRLLKED